MADLIFHCHACDMTYGRHTLDCPEQPTILVPVADLKPGMVLLLQEDNGVYTTHRIVRLESVGRDLGMTIIKAHVENALSFSFMGTNPAPRAVCSFSMPADQGSGPATGLESQ